MIHPGMHYSSTYEMLSPRSYDMRRFWDWDPLGAQIFVLSAALSGSGKV